MAGGSGTQNQGQTPATGGTTQPPTTSGYGGTTTPTLMNPSLYNPMTSPINTSGFGGAGQMPSFANNPFMGTSPFSSVNSTTQQDMMGGGGRGGYGGSFGDFLQRSLGGGFGGQQPNAGSQFNAAQNPGAAANQFKVPDWVQEPEPGMVTGQAFTEITNPATGEKFMAPNTGYSVRGQQQQSPRGWNPYQQPQQVPQSALQSPEFQGYQTQMRGLQQQMDEYVRKAPMYQQLEDLNNKMQAYQQRHIGQFQQPQAMQQAMQRQMMQRQSPFRQNPYQRQLGGGIQGLMGILGGRGGMGMASPGSYEQYANANNQALARASQEVKRPTMSRADFDARNIMSMGMPQYQRAMTMDMPQYQGRSFDLPTNFMKNGGKV